MKPIKNQSPIKLGTIIVKFFTFALFLVACDGMKTELDIDAAAFPPKLCVTAILDGKSGVFTIVLTEGRSLADYKTPRPSEQTIIRDGEIRLYEDDRLILTEAGRFDMTVSDRGWYDSEQSKYGYRFEATEITTHPGRTYRLEAEVNGYPLATSTSVMPFPPDVSASINSNVTVKKRNVKQYSSLGGWSGGSMGGDNYYCPIPLQWGERDAGRNYYALEMYIERETIEGTPTEWEPDGRFNIGVFVDDLSKLQDNPEVEIFEGQDIEIDIGSGSEPVDMYYFPILLMSDFYFTPDNASLTLFQAKTPAWEIEPPDRPDDDGYEYVVQQNTLTLRVRSITTATFRYYRSLTLQSTGMGFFSEPVQIVSNIENGYGGFNVFNATDFELVQYKSYYYRQKGYW
jgi:hypothetical protein